MTLLGSFLISVPPAGAADDAPDLEVRISSLSPSHLTSGSRVTLGGTVTNNDSHTWRTVQAYLVIPATPYTTRAQVDEAIGNGKAYTGTRIVDIGLYDELGDLAPNQSHTFEVSVPWDHLGITGAEGVYPVGVQILATDADGTRSDTAIARATTFLPLISARQAPVPTSILWPFLMTDYRGVDGAYVHSDDLLRSVSPGGQMRNLLDLASSTVGTASTLLLDPALLVGIDDLSRGRHLPKSFTVTAPQKALAADFLQDLLTFSRTHATWVMDYDRPDDLALTMNGDLRRPLEEAIDRATESALTTYQISGRRVSWPTRDGVTSAMLGNLRGSGDSPAIVTPSSVPGWEPRLGSMVQYTTSRGPMPLLVNAVRNGDTPGQDSTVTLRQRLLSDAALAVLERAIDPTSRADAVTMVDPQWDPGVRWATGNLSEGFTAPFTTGQNLERFLTQSLSSYTGRAPSRAKATPISRAQLRSATAIVSAGQLLSSVIQRSDGVEDSLARTVSGVLGVRWRLDPATGMTIAATRARRTGAELDKVTIEAPPAVTLSSSKGGFPLTIRNGSESAIRVGIALASSNPALSIPSVKPIDVGPGERHTVTVQVDLGRQRTTYLTARLATEAGQSLGAPTTFKVRSSRIGVVLWVAMGLAGLFVLVTLVHRFHRRRTRTATQQLADDDD